MNLIFKTVKISWLYILFLLLFIILSTILSSLFPKYTQIVLDGEYNVTRIYILFSIGIGSILANFISSLISLKLSNSISFFLNKEIMNNLVRAKFNFFDNKDKGVILTRISADIEEFKSFVVSLTTGLMKNILSLIIILPIMINMSLIISIIVSIIILSMVVINICYSKKIKNFSIDVKNKRDKLGSLKLKYLLNIENIKANCLETKVIREYEQNLNLSIYSFNKRYILQNILSNTSQVFSVLLICIIYGIGFYMIKNNNLSFGEMIAFSMYGNMLYRPISSLITIRNSWCSVESSIKRIEEYLELEKENYSGRKINRIRDIKFISAYKTFDSTLLKYDLHADSKQNYAIIGENGSGKTTLFRLLLGLYPVNGGHLKVNASEIDLLAIGQFRSRISYLSQSVPLMQGTIKDVIGVNLENREQFKNYINSFKLTNVLLNGEDTLIDGNLSLSGGEQQSLKIIKALLSDCDLILLDEPTNNLDIERKSVFIELLKKIDKIVLIVTHDEDVISVCDKIYKIG